MILPFSAGRYIRKQINFSIILYVEGAVGTENWISGDDD